MGQILLVRHGQASWAAEDYDVLSPMGHRQGRLLGAALAARGVRPDVVISGGMRRHRETTENVLEALGRAADVVEDSDWDEYDHVSMLTKVPHEPAGEKPTAAEFQAWIERATTRWTSGEFDEEYAEPFPAFTDRVRSALERAVAIGSGTTLVITSGGPISWVATSLIDGGIPTWARLNVVCANTGLTKLITGRRGVTLVGFNEHTHLEGVPGALTYR